MTEKELQRLRADFIALRALSLVLAHRLNKLDPSLKELIANGLTEASQFLLRDEILEGQGEWAVTLQIACDDLKNRLAGI